MKDKNILINIAIVAVLCISIAEGKISERTVDNAKKSAMKSGKVIAFLFYEKKIHAAVAADQKHNIRKMAALKAVVPRAKGVIVEVCVDEDGVECLPKIIKKGNKLPSIVITDPKCESVICDHEGEIGQEKKEEMEKKIEAAAIEARKIRDAQ